MSGASVTVASDDPSVTWTVVGDDPLEVRVPLLPVGKTLTVQLRGRRQRPTATTPTSRTHASAFATNASDVVGAMPASTLRRERHGDLRRPRQRLRRYRGQRRAPRPATTAMRCTVDACVAGACTADAGRTAALACTSGADCEDADTCTLDVCGRGRRVRARDAAALPGLQQRRRLCRLRCLHRRALRRHGSCLVTVTPGCNACASDADCNDADACTTDSCAAGACVHAAIPSCVAGRDLRRLPRQRRRRPRGLRGPPTAAAARPAWRSAA